jgi:hypothetical protein
VDKTHFGLLAGLQRQTCYDSVSEAEVTLRSCQASVEKAARAVCAEAYRSIREEIAVLEDQTEQLRRQSWDLQAVADYPPARWQPHLRVLLVDPEAPLLPGDPKIPISGNSSAT